MKCPECNTEMESRIKKVPEEFKGEKIQLTYPVWICPKCHEEMVEVGVLDKAWEKQWEIYKEAHQIPSPDDIKNARERLGLTGEELAQMLGKTRSLISKLENGERNLSDSLLEAYREYIIPGGDAMMPLLVQAVAQKRLTEEQKETLTAKMNLSGNVSLKIKANLIKETQGKKPGPENGSSTFNEELFCGIASYIILKQCIIDKMGLMKLFFYLDSEYYQISGKSLTGLRYIYNIYGPTPFDYNTLASYLLEAQILKETDKEYEFKTGDNADKYLSYLPKEQKRFLNNFLTVYTAFTSKELSKMSHQEPFWQKAEQGKLIRFNEGMITKRVKKG